MTSITTSFRFSILLSTLLVSACGSSHGRDDDGGAPSDSALGIDAGSDAGAGEVCGPTTCAVGDSCCAVCGGTTCVRGDTPCPVISCPAIIRSCDQALELGSSGLLCDFEGGCGSVGGCCRGSAECIDGVTVVEMTCVPDCGPASCSSSSECAPDEYCQLAPMCEPGSGVCVARPMGCTADCPGVCGCDGNFYCNACSANATGVSIIEGASPDEPATCGPPPPSSDCRATGCPAGTTCEPCWATYECLPPGTDC